MCDPSSVCSQHLLFNASNLIAAQLSINQMFSPTRKVRAIGLKVVFKVASPQAQGGVAWGRGYIQGSSFLGSTAQLFLHGGKTHHAQNAGCSLFRFQEPIDTYHKRKHGMAMVSLVPSTRQGYGKTIPTKGLWWELHWEYSLVAPFL